MSRAICLAVDSTYGCLCTRSRCRASRSPARRPACPSPTSRPRRRRRPPSPPPWSHQRLHAHTVRSESIIRITQCAVRAASDHVPCRGARRRLRARASGERWKAETVRRWSGRGAGAEPRGRGGPRGGGAERHCASRQARPRGPARPASGECRVGTAAGEQGPGRDGGRRAETAGGGRRLELGRAVARSLEPRAVGVRL